MIVLACDPGFAAFGYAIAERDAQHVHRVLRMGVLRTQKASKKQRVLVADDNFHRCRQLAKSLRGLILEHGVQAVVFEAFSVPMKSAPSNLVKIGMPYGILAGLVGEMPALLMTPQEIRRAVGVPKGGSKDDVEALVLQRLGGSAVVKAFMAECPKSLQNHAYDALAVYLACWESDLIRLASVEAT